MSSKSDKTEKIFFDIKEVYDWLKTLTVKNTKSFSYSIFIKNPDGTTLKFDGGGGGAHALINKNVIIPKEDEILETADVGSYYPASLINLKAVPEHLPVEDFIHVYEGKRDERIIVKKKGDANMADFLKLQLNSVYGNLNNSYSWLYDWKQTLKITVNGQIIFLKMVQELIKIGVNVVSVNTDGLEILYHKDLKPKVDTVFGLIGDMFNYEFEYDEYKAIYYLNINNYFAITKKDKRKKKGLFMTDPPLENSHDSLVIPKAIESHLTTDVNYIDFIKNHNNIFDFCNSFKIAKKYKVYHNGGVVQNLNRFYAGVNAPFLYKKKKESKDYEHVFSPSGVFIFNQYEEKPMKDYKINYEYYINEAMKILYDLNLVYKQTTLF
jgi:hypothetical protein